MYFNVIIVSTGGAKMEEYKNEDGKCECYKCELKESCQYKDRYQRLPRKNRGALGLCKKL